MFGKNKSTQPQQEQSGRWGGGPEAQDGGPVPQPAPVDPLFFLADRLSVIENAQVAQIAALTDQLGEKDRMLAAMNDTVASSRRDQVAVLLAPAARKLIALAHQARSASGKHRSASDTKTADEFDFFAEKVTDALEALGFEEVECEPGTPFNPRQHEAVKTTPVGDSALDRTVATVLRPGFRFAGATKTAFPVQVIVNGYEPDTTTLSTTHHEEN